MTGFRPALTCTKCFYFRVPIASTTPTAARQHAAWQSVERPADYSSSKWRPHCSPQALTVGGREGRRGLHFDPPRLPPPRDDEIGLDLVLVAIMPEAQVRIGPSGLGHQLLHHKRFKQVPEAIHARAGRSAVGRRSGAGNASASAAPIADMRRSRSDSAAARTMSISASRQKLLQLFLPIGIIRRWIARATSTAVQTSPRRCSSRGRARSENLARRIMGPAAGIYLNWDNRGRNPRRPLAWRQGAGGARRASQVARLEGLAQGRVRQAPRASALPGHRQRTARRLPQGRRFAAGALPPLPPAPLLLAEAAGRTSASLAEPGTEPRCRPWDRRRSMLMRFGGFPEPFLRHRRARRAAGRKNGFRARRARPDWYAISPAAVACGPAARARLLAAFAHAPREDLEVSHRALTH